MTDVEYLYGLPDAEWLKDDPEEAVVEAWETDDTEGSGPWVVEKWESAPAADLVWNTDIVGRLVEDLYVDLGELDGRLDRVADDDRVQEAERALKEAVARHLGGYRRATKRVGESTWTVTDDGDPVEVER